VKKLIVCIALLIAACHDKRPPQPTAEQSHQLNDAEDMLNNMAQNDVAPNGNGFGNQSAH
jgi:hypothetical protein